jgi:GTP cyclohydrolase II
MAAAQVRVRGSRALVLTLVAELWADVVAGRRPAGERLALFQAACSDAAAGASAAVDGLCEAAGTTANAIGHPLERLARDVRVVRQHASVASHHLEDAGRILLGLPGEGLMLKGIGPGP